MLFPHFIRIHATPTHTYHTYSPHPARFVQIQANKISPVASQTAKKLNYCILESAERDETR